MGCGCVIDISLAALNAGDIYKMNTVIPHTNADVADRCRCKINSNTTHLTAHGQSITKTSGCTKCTMSCRTILGFWKTFPNERQTIGIKSRTWLRIRPQKPSIDPLQWDCANLTLWIWSVLLLMGGFHWMCRTTRRSTQLMNSGVSGISRVSSDFSSCMEKKWQKNLGGWDVVHSLYETNVATQIYPSKQVSASY